MNAVEAVKSAPSLLLDPKASDKGKGEIDKVALDFQNMIAKKMLEQGDVAISELDEDNSTETIEALGKKQLKEKLREMPVAKDTKQVDKAKADPKSQADSNKMLGLEVSSTVASASNTQASSKATAQGASHKPSALDSKSAQDIAKLSAGHGLNMTKLKVDYESQTHNQSKGENLVAKSEQVKVPSTLADLLNKISHEDAMARAKAHSKAKSEREEIVNSKMRSKERAQRYEAAIKELEGRELEVKEARSALQKAPRGEGVELKEDAKESLKVLDEHKKDSKKVKTLESRSDKAILTSELKNNQSINFTRANISSFASEIKEVVKNYSPPITKLEIQLNPKELGKIELNMIKNGNDLQVAITGNAHAITLLSLKQDDLLSSLQSIGFNDVDLNFSNHGSSGGDGKGGKESKEQHLAHSSQSDESHEYSELTITLPQYV